MVKILFCPPLFPPSRGGSQRLFADLARLWCAGSGSAAVYTSALPGGTVAPGAVDDQSTVRRFPLLLHHHPRMRGRLLGAVSHHGPLWWRCATGFPHWLAPGYRRFLAGAAMGSDGPFGLVVGGVLPHTHFLEPAARFVGHPQCPVR